MKYFVWRRGRLMFVFILVIFPIFMILLDMKHILKIYRVKKILYSIRKNFLTKSHPSLDVLRSRVKQRDEVTSPKLSRKNYEFVIVVQVHNRTREFQLTVQSFKKVERIEHTLVVFSHDLYDENINAIVDAVDFCDTAQIFYPYSIQLNPGRFPGTSPNDCLPNIGQDKAISVGCDNAHWPDSYGVYREAKFSQMKLHWWWKMVTVFNKLEVSKDLKIPFMFIEDDNYLAPDVLIMLKKLWKLMQTKDQPFVLSMGGWADLRWFNVTYANRGDIKRWQLVHNMGVVMDKALWETIRKCKNYYCFYDDYNWDQTMIYMFRDCVEPKVLAATLQLNRIQHIGVCGVHMRSEDCDPMGHVRLFEKYFSDNKKEIESLEIILQDSTSSYVQPPGLRGAFADRRDHELCLKIAS